MLPIKLYDYRTLQRSNTFAGYEVVTTGNVSGYAYLSELTGSDVGLDQVENARNGAFYVLGRTADTIVAGLTQVMVDGEWYTLLAKNTIDMLHRGFVRFAITHASYEVQDNRVDPEAEV